MLVKCARVRIDNKYILMYSRSYFGIYRSIEVAYFHVERKCGRHLQNYYQMQYTLSHVRLWIFQRVSMIEESCQGNLRAIKNQWRPRI